MTPPEYGCMKNICYPLKRRIEPWEYLLLLGFVAGPVLGIYAVLYSSWKVMWQVTAYVSGIAYMFLSFKILRDVIGNMTSLEWDDEWLRWGLCPQRWADLKSVKVMSVVSKRSFTRSIRYFRRDLVIFDERGRERMRILFQHRNSRGIDRVRHDDPIWIEFLHTVETRLSLPDGFFARELDLYEERREESAKQKMRTSPLLIIWISIYIGMLILAVNKADDATMDLFFEGNVISAMIFFRYKEYKRGPTPALAFNSAACVFLLMTFNLDTHKFVYLRLFIASLLWAYLGKKIGWDKGVRYLMRNMQGRQGRGNFQNREGIIMSSPKNEAVKANMTISRLIEELKKCPEDLNVIGYSSHCEKAGEIENVVGFEAVTINDKYYLNNTLYEKSAEPIHFALVQTSMYNAMTVKQVLAELLKLSVQMTVVYHPHGSTVEHRYIEINAASLVMCAKFKKNFRDIMDHTDYADDVYGIDNDKGTDMILLHNTEVTRRRGY